MIYAQWHGGPSYSPSGIEHREQFATLEEAREALRDRVSSDGRRQVAFHKAGAEKPEWTFTPAVTEDSYLDLFATPTSEEFYARLEFGPRGGVKKVNA